MKKNKLLRKIKQFPYNFLFGLGITIFIFTISLVSIIWTPHDITVLNIRDKLTLPGNSVYLLGTDHFGRDIVSMIMLGAKTSLLVAFTATPLFRLAK